MFFSSGCKQNPVQSTEPTVEIISPRGNISSYDSVRVTLTASDDEKIIRVELFIDHVLVKVFTEEPYEYVWYIQSFYDGSQHVLEARAYDEDGNVAATKPVIIYTYKFRPSNLSATFLSDTTVTLSWIDNSKVETGFEIEQRVNNGEFRYVWSVGENSTTATVECHNVFTDTLYYRVRARKGSERSDYSNEASASRTLSAPTNVRLSYDSDTTIRVTWKDNSMFESGYRIAVGNHVYDPVPANTSEYAAALRLRNGEYYTAVVTAIRGTVTGMNGKSAMKQYVVPIPYDVSIVSQGPNHLTITWNDTCAYEKGFIIERAESPGAYAIVGRTDADAVQFKDTNVDTLKQYSYRVITETHYTASSPSKEFSISYVPGLFLMKSNPLRSFVQSFTLSKDQKKAVTTDFNYRTVSLWNLESMTLEKDFFYDDSTAQGPQRAELHPDGTKVAVGYYYKYVIFFDVASGNRMSFLELSPGQRSGVSSLAYNPDGKKLLTGDREISIWQDKTNVKLGSISTMGNTPAVNYSPVDESFITCPWSGGAIKVYDANSLSLIRQLDNSDDAYACSYNTDGSLIVGKTRFGILVWDSNTGAAVNRLLSIDDLTSAEMNADREFLFASQYLGGISIWSLKTNKLIFRVKDDPARNDRIKLSNDGKYLYSAGDTKIRKWEIRHEWRSVE